MPSDRDSVGNRTGAALPWTNRNRRNQPRQYGSPGTGGRGGSFGPAPRTSPKTYVDDMDRNRRAAHPPAPRAQAAVPDNTQYLKTLADFMQQARETLGKSAQSTLSTALAGFGNREQDLRNQAGASDQNIGRGYQALSGFINGTQAPAIAQNYQQSSDQVAQAGQAAQNAINTGNRQANAQQQAILNRLGIGDTNIVLQNKGTTNAQQQADNVADAAGRTQGTQNMLGANRQTAQNLNTAAGTAGQLEGRGAQDNIQKQLFSAIAGLNDQRAEATAKSQVTEADVMALAQQLMDQDRGVWEGNYNRKYQVETDAQDRADAAIQAQIEAAQAGAAPEMNSTTYSSLGPIGQATYALQQSGVDPTQSKVIANAIQQAYNSGNMRSAQDFIKIVQQNLGQGADPLDAANAAGIFYRYFD